MSLKTFHLIFVAVTTLLCIFVAVWGLVLAPLSVAEFAKKLAIASIIGAVIMPIYGISFYGKVKKLSAEIDS